MRKLTLLLVVLLAGCTDDPVQVPAFGLQATPDTGIIHGIVVDAAIVPVADVLVDVQGLGTRTTTDTEGRFGIEGIPPGTYFLRFSKPGYESVQQSVDVRAGQSAPPLLNVQVPAAPGTAPAGVLLQASGFIACSAATLLTVHPICHNLGTGDDRSLLDFPVNGVPDVFQSEVVWESTQPLGTDLYEINYIYDLQSGATTGDRIGQGLGTSPIIHRSADGGPAAVGLGAGTGVRIGLFSGGPVLETGVAIDQRFDAFVSLFYNMDPGADWSFIDDGAP